jgi:hypothetical protein
MLGNAVGTEKPVGNRPRESASEELGSEIDVGSPLSSQSSTIALVELAPIATADKVTGLGAPRGPLSRTVY